VLFCGEEVGLKGSEAFVEWYPDLDNVVLMLQLDMTNGSEWLIPFVDAGGESAPTWLVRAAFEEYSKLGYSGMRYPTNFFVANNALPRGGVGSDHIPFLKEGIPAIDFTSDINDPIHTLQDSFEYFRLSGLKRSGDLVYRLVERFDGGVPNSNGTENYYFLQIFSYPVFLPLWSLYLIVFFIVGFSVLVLLTRREQWLVAPPGLYENIKGARPSIPAIKFLLFMFIIQIFVWFSDNVVGWIKGVRHPWYANPDGYVVLGLLGGIIGIWIALQLVKVIKLSQDSYRYFLRTVVFFLIYIAAFLFISVKLALYPAVGLFFIGLAMTIKNPFWRIAAFIVSPHMMFRLFFSEGFPLVARAFAQFNDNGLAGLIGWHIVYIIFSTLWSFPFLLGFAAIYVDLEPKFRVLPLFRRWYGIAISGSAFVICAVVLFFVPSFTDEWRQVITVEQKYDASAGTGALSVASAEYLNNAKVIYDNHDTLITSLSHRVNLKEISGKYTDWLKASRTVVVTQDSVQHWSVVLTISTKHRPYKLKVNYAGKKEKIENQSSSFVSYSVRGKAYISWYSFPETPLIMPISFTTAEADTITETVEAVFVGPLQDVKVIKENSNVIYRTALTRSEVLHKQ
jgi:hypothetical protein